MSTYSFINPPLAAKPIIQTATYLKGPVNDGSQKRPRDRSTREKPLPKQASGFVSGG
jgi:hypothetical protein